MVDSTNAGILRCAQNDMVQWFFSSRLESGGPSRLTGLSFGVLGLLELSDSNSAVWENGPDFQASTHRSDKIGQRADVHVSSALDFGNGGLVYAQDFRKVFLASGDEPRAAREAASPG